MNQRIKSIALGLLCIAIFTTACCQHRELSERIPSGNADEFAKKREAMVTFQIKERGVTDETVLRAMRKVERHQFVPKAYQNKAYEDYPLPIGCGQTISQPYIVALMTASLNLKGHEKVLEIGTGSGYQAAILAEICDSVFTIEIFEELGNNAEITLKRLGYKNISVKIGDGYQGWKAHAPYDAIIVTCAPTHIPPELIQQLAEKGKMIIPLGESYVQELVLLIKEKGSVNKKSIIPVRFVPMIQQNGRTY